MSEFTLPPGAKEVACPLCGEMIPDSEQFSTDPWSNHSILWDVAFHLFDHGVHRTGDHCQVCGEKMDLLYSLRALHWLKDGHAHATLFTLRQL